MVQKCRVEKIFSVWPAVKLHQKTFIWEKRSEDSWLCSHEVDTSSIPGWLAISTRRIGQFATASTASSGCIFLIPEATLQRAIWQQSSSISTIPNDPRRYKRTCWGREGSHVLKCLRYFWTKAGSHPTISLNKQNKHLNGERSLQCSWNSLLLHMMICTGVCSSKKSRLLPTGFVSRISCFSENCE